MDICFAEHRLHRAQLVTDEDNPAAISCYEKVGFHLDGCLRELIKTESGYKDEYIYSVLREEWSRRRHGAKVRVVPRRADGEAP